MEYGNNRTFVNTKYSSISIGGMSDTIIGTSNCDFITNKSLTSPCDCIKISSNNSNIHNEIGVFTANCNKFVLTDTDFNNNYIFVMNENSLDITSENKDAKLIFNGVDVVSEIMDLKKKLNELIDHVNYMPGGPGYADAKQEFENLSKS